MKIGRDYGVFPRGNSWGRAAGDLGIEPGEALARVRELTGAVTAAFAAAAAAPAVAELRSPLPARLPDLISDRAARCAQVLAAGQG